MLISVMETDAGNQILFLDTRFDAVREVKIQRHGFLYQEGQSQFDGAKLNVGVCGGLDADDDGARILARVVVQLGVVLVGAVTAYICATAFLRASMGSATATTCTLSILTKLFMCAPARPPQPMSPSLIFS